MSIYDELVPVVRDVMGEFQQGEINLVKLEPGDGPPDNPGPSTPVRTRLDATASGVSAKLVQDGFATATDLMVIAATIDGIVIGVNDRIEIDGIQHTIVKDMTVPAAGTKLAWKLVVRRGG